MILRIISDMNPFKNINKPVKGRVVGTLGVLVLMAVSISAVRFVTNGFSTKTREERALLAAFSEWAEKNVTDNITECSITNRQAIPDSGTYIDSSYTMLHARLSMLDKLVAFLDEDKDGRQNGIAFQQRWVESMSSLPDSVRSDGVLALEQERLRRMKALNGKEAEKETVSLYSERAAVRESVSKIENTPGWITTYDVTIDDDRRFRLLFVSTEKKPYELFLFSVSEIEKIENINFLKHVQ